MEATDKTNPASVTPDQEMQNLLAQLKAAKDPAKKTELVTAMRELAKPKSAAALPVELAASHLEPQAAPSATVEPTSKPNGVISNPAVQELLIGAPAADCTVREVNLGPGERGITLEPTDLPGMWLRRIRAEYNTSQLVRRFLAANKARGMPSFAKSIPSFAQNLKANLTTNFEDDDFAKAVIEHALALQPSWSVNSMGRLIAALAGDLAHLQALDLASSTVSGPCSE